MKWTFWLCNYYAIYATESVFRGKSMASLISCICCRVFTAWISTSYHISKLENMNKNCFLHVQLGQCNMSANDKFQLAHAQIHKISNLGPSKCFWENFVNSTKVSWQIPSRSGVLLLWSIVALEIKRFCEFNGLPH